MAGSQPVIAGVAGRYALALFDLARDAKQLDKVEADLVSFQAMLDDSPDLRRLISSPSFSAEQQSLALAAILGKAGIKDLVASFFAVLARNRRLFAAPDIVRTYRQLLAADKGEVEATVISASELSAQQAKSLEQALKAAMGQTVQLTQRVDPGLLGGLVIRVGSRMIDGSLRTKLRNLKFAMKEVG